jgi:hypothetical protein
VKKMLHESLDPGLDGHKETGSLGSDGVHDERLTSDRSLIEGKQEGQSLPDGTDELPTPSLAIACPDQFNYLEPG